MRRETGIISLLCFVPFCKIYPIPVWQKLLRQTSQRPWCAPYPRKILEGAHTLSGSKRRRHMSKRTGSEKQEPSFFVPPNVLLGPAWVLLKYVLQTIFSSPAQCIWSSSKEVKSNLQETFDIPMYSRHPSSQRFQSLFIVSTSKPNFVTWSVTV